MLKTMIIDRKQCDDYMIIKLKKPDNFEFSPGQFIMIKNKTEPFMAKPFSLIDTNDNTITLLIRIIGRLTNYIKNMSYSEELYMRGPYGTPFIKTIDINNKYILIGAGCGSAPLIHFNKVYSELVEKAFFGFKNYSIKEILNDKNIYIDEETKKNIVQTAFEYYNKSTKKNLSFIISGNENMVKNSLEKFKNIRAKKYVSLDERMGCGIGMCKGCPVNTTNGIKMVCKDGTLFNSEELIFEW